MIKYIKNRQNALGDIPDETIGRAYPVDTFARGTVDLTTNTWILCPKNEVEKLRKDNPKCHVMGYETERALGFAPALLSQLGYRAEDVSNFYWMDNDSQMLFLQLMNQLGIKTAPHSDTYFCAEEYYIGSINLLLGLQNGFDRNDSKYAHDFNFLCEEISRCLIMRDNSVREQNDVEPQEIIRNNRQMDICR